MDEDDLAYNKRKELQEQGYKSFEEKEHDTYFKRALQDYERKLTDPYNYY